MSSLVETAERIARKSHENQFRKFDNKEPYINHPARVAANFYNEILIAAGWLHDVLEDTTTTKQDLVDAGLPHEVIDIVECLTRKQNETYFDFIMRVSENSSASVVKLADIDDNMATLKESSLKDKYRFARKVLASELVDTGFIPPD
jgi:(p)ppGpp synthase/HD superfamily hydrolase